MKITVLIWFFFVSTQQISAIKLNYPRVLLPIFEKLSINFTLDVIEGGCFKWSSSRPDLISITPVFDNNENYDCTSKAVVTTLFREKRRSTAFVLAEDLSTGEVLRCDVILDVIDQLGVLTTTRELYLEEAPETFELWAQDSQGNAFTTLEGVEFNWRISSQSPIEAKEADSWQQVLRFLRFSESKYHDVPATVEKFDRLGLRGYMVLLEGINTGSAKVTVQLPYSEYSGSVTPIEVNIMVLANIILDPSDVHILVGDSISFRILQLKQGKLEDITHNNQYYLEVENSELASIRANTATGHILGRTSIILKDRNVAANLANMVAESIPSIRAIITISRAEKLMINLLPFYNWVTIEGEQHTIGIDLYTHDNQLITLGAAYTVSSKFDERIFYRISSTVNGSRIYGETVKTGSSIVTGTYEQLKAKAELQVYKKIELNPARVVLPYDAIYTSRQQIQYKAMGGDGLFVWSSLNGNLVGVSQNGLAETKVGNLNEAIHDRNEQKLSDFAQVKVALQRNAKISKTADILFLPPSKLKIVRYNFETTLKDYVFLHVALYAEQNGELLPFTTCKNLHFEYDFSEIFQLDVSAQLPAHEQIYESACHLAALRSTALGNSHFRISYKYLDSILRDEVNLIVFEKLEILNPVSNEVVLPIGSSRNIIYENGPQKVFNIDAELTKSVKLDESIAIISSVKNEFAADKHIFNVLCKKIGSTTISFEIFNTLISSNHVPYVSRFKTQVHCVKPRFINLYTTEKIRPSCPLKVKHSLMHVKRNEDQLEIVVEVLDANNRKLQNISSLILAWKFAQSDNGHYDDDIVHQRKHEDDLVAGVAVPRRDYLLTSIPNIQNTFKIKATVVGYDQKMLYAQSIAPESPEFGIPKSGKTTDDGELHKPIIENELSFLAVNSTLLPFDSVSIFLAHGHRQRIPIVQGSGFYDIKISESDIVNAVFDAEAKEIVIEPLRIGQVGIDVIDRCLMTDASRLFVSVVSIGRIVIQVPDRVEKTKTIEALVYLYDSLDNLLALDYENLHIYDLRENIYSPNILSMVLGDKQNLNDGELRYLVTGVELGETKITITSGSGENLISSPAVAVQVFPPLRLSPRNSTIVVGSSIQIESHGGPYPDVNIVFSVEHENIATIESTLVQGLHLGKTTVTGRCVGINPVTSQQIVFSEDQIEIHVAALHKVKIQTPLRRVRSGTVLPASVWGAPNISPMILGTLPSAKVKWSTNQPDVIEILGIFSAIGIEYDDFDSISVRLKALNPGTAKIQAEFQTQNGVQTCFIEITVFKLLELESPKRITSDAIIVPPKSKINLKANLPDVSFQFAEETIGGLKVSANGELTTSENIGRDIVIATVDDQTLSIPIETKNIHYVLATLHPQSIKLKNRETKIPSGMNVILKVSLHDNLGNEFSHGLQDTSLLIHKLSRKEGIDVNFGSNFTVLVNLPRETSNMLSISIKNAIGVKYIEDILKLSVSKSENKFPTKKIFSIGDIICFDSPLASINDWTTSDETIVSIDKGIGIGLVVASRSKFGEQVTVTNGNEHYGHIKYELEIREADTIKFHQAVDIFNGKNYKGHLIIKNHLQMDKLSNLFARNLTTCTASLQPFSLKFFRCDLKLLNQVHGNAEKVMQILNTVAVYDRRVGAYACNIHLTSSIGDLINLVKNDEHQFELVATLANGISASSNLKMIPAISVSPLEITLEQVEQQTITVSGLDKILQKVQLSTSDPSALQIMPTAKSHGFYQYKVKVLKYLPMDETLSVIVHSPLTIQTIKIQIQSVKISPKCVNQPFQSVTIMAMNVISNIGLIISALIVLSATIWAFVYCFSSRVNQAEAFPPFQKPQQRILPIQHSSSDTSTLKGPLYPTSPFLDRSQSSNGSQSNLNNSFNQSNTSPVYGDSTLLSPNKRINRRYL